MNFPINELITQIEERTAQVFAGEMEFFDRLLQLPAGLDAGIPTSEILERLERMAELLRALECAGVETLRAPGRGRP